MTAKTYPGKWYRVQQRGCTPNGIGCLHMDWPIERQDLSPTRTDTRHVVPKSVLRYCLDAQLQGRWGCGYLRIDKVWRAYGQRRPRATVYRVTGRTEREALQNLCAEMKVKLP